MNSIYLRKKEDESVSDLLVPYLKRAGLNPEKIGREYLTQIAHLLKENLVVLSQVEEYLGIFFDERFAFEESARAILADAKNRETLQLALGVFEAFQEMTVDSWPSLQAQLEEKTGRKGKSLYAPLRAGITGKMKGPELAKTLPLIGKERIIRRLKMALEFRI